MSPVQQPVTFEGQYVSKTVGPALTKGLAEIIEKRPADPVEYLANFLQKFVTNRKQQEIDEEVAKQVELLRIEEEKERERLEKIRLEEEALREQEEELRRQHEAEERRKREMEELAKRREELANAAPSMPSLAEEEDLVVEFGDNKLHELAAVAGSSLQPLFKENFNIAVRNSQFKTAREIAVESKLNENVKQIDDFVCDLIMNEKYKQLNDLVLLGFSGVQEIAQARFGDAEKMKSAGMISQAEQVYTQLPQTQAKIRELRTHLEKNELEPVKKILEEKKWLACFRDEQGKTSIHLAIERGYFELAIYLLDKCPILTRIGDCVILFFLCISFQKKYCGFLFKKKISFFSQHLAW